jgi:hypothetical protein
MGSTTGARPASRAGYCLNPTVDLELAEDKRDVVADGLLTFLPIWSRWSADRRINSTRQIRRQRDRALAAPAKAAGAAAE